MQNLPLRLLFATPLFALAACGGKAPDAGKTAEASGAPTAPPTAVSSEWVEPNPTEPAVPVELPKTATASAPDKAAPAAK